MSTRTDTKLNVRPFSYDDLDAVLGFLAESFPDCPAKADQRYFRWRFEQHPLGPTLAMYWLAFDGDRLVGQLGTIRDRLRVAGRWREALWLVDLFVAPKYRGGLAALRLFQAAIETDMLLLAVGAGPPMTPLYQALGWRRLAIADSFYFPIRPGRLAGMARATEAAPGWLSSLRPLLSIANRTMPVMQRMASRQAVNTKVTVAAEPLADFAQQAEDLFEQRSVDSEITSLRNAEILTWKFDQRPVGSHFALTARDRNTGELQGYMVVKKMRRAGNACWFDVADYWTAVQDVEVFGALLTMLEQESLRRGVDFVRLRLSRPEHTALLRFPRWHKRTRPVTDEVFVYTRDGALADHLARDPWHLTALVSDRVDYGGDEWEESAGVA